MSKTLAVFITACAWLCACSGRLYANDSTWRNISPGIFDLHSLVMDDQRVMYIAAGNEVSKREDNATQWDELFAVKGANRVITSLYMDSYDRGTLYAASGSGLYRSANSGRDWARIYKGRACLENECTCVAASGDSIYLATKAGLFLSHDRGKTWRRAAGKPGRSYIHSIALAKGDLGRIYAVSVNGLFVSQDAGASWERRMVVSGDEDINTAEEETGEQERESAGFKMRYVTTDQQNPSQAYLATNRGVYKSTDKGLSWERLVDYGLLDRDVRILLVASSAKLYAATKSGIFEYAATRWQEVSTGLATRDVRGLAADASGRLYAACDGGLFEADRAAPRENKSVLSLYFKDEPEIEDVQEQAVRYAEVEPEKIINWRKLAAKRSILPKVSVGIGRNVTDLWHWEGGSSTVCGDDRLVRGQDALEWDLSLSWDLSELIWSSDQTSIDVRSRLTVQLREDILDEVTKLYFERIRIKMELDNLSIEDRNKRLGKELKLRELTASLDALTGGYYSECLKAAGKP